MKDRKIKIISPITAFVVMLLDAAVLGYGIFAVSRLISDRSTAVIIFSAIEVIAFIVAVFVTKEVFSNGVVFRDDEMEFLGIDYDNLFSYNDIVDVEAEKDDKASLTKNFVDRHAKLILSLKDDKVVTVDIGLCTKNTLELIKKETLTRIGKEYSPKKVDKDVAKFFSDDDGKNDF